MLCVTNMKYRKTVNDRMIIAIYMNNKKILDRCLKRGADPNYMTEGQYAPIHLATQTGNYEMVAALLKYKSLRIDQYTDHYITPLIIACTLNNGEILELLLKSGANPNKTDFWGRTPLLIAIRFSFYNIIELLIKYRANVNSVDCFDNTPLITSLIDKPDMKTARYLLEQGAIIDYSSKKLPIFFEAILHTDNLARVDSVLLLLDQGIDVNYIDPFTGRNCLHFVSITGYYPLAVILVNRGARIDVCDRMDRTPLTVALDHEHRPLIKLFRTRMLKGTNDPK